MCRLQNVRAYRYNMVSIRMIISDLAVDKNGRARGKEISEVSEESRNRATMDPMELWRQWYETGIKMWSNMLGGKPENYIDPYGLYRQWFNSLEDAWERIFESARKSPMGMMNNPMMAAMSPAALTQPTASQTPAVEAPA